MLVLSRKNGEGIVIMIGEEQVEVIMTEARTGRARLAVNAPKDVKILRSELLCSDDTPATPLTN